jgi:hypothetical protein
MIMVFPIASALAQETDENDEAVSKDGVLLSCGVERWAVKTCYDADTVNLDFTNIVQSSIAYQRSLPVPTLPSDNITRLAFEDTVYQLNCHLIEIKLESDQDIHCVISTIGNTAETMVAEVVNPECPNIVNTSRYNQFKILRDWIVSTYNPTTSFKQIGVDVQITGVGFYDFLHGQTGIPPNGREIHPILSMIPLSQLPVELTSFAYSTVNNSIKLHWETKTEINNNLFEIERKSKNSNWAKIGEIKGSGNSTSPKQYSFTDNVFLPNGKYDYRLKQVDYNGQYNYSKEIEVNLIFIPKEYSLENNFPNPFNPTTVIRYSLPFDSNVRLIIYNTQGQLINELVNGVKSAGAYEINFNAASLSSGIYFYSITANSLNGNKNYSETKKMSLVK